MDTLKTKVNVYLIIIFSYNILIILPKSYYNIIIFIKRALTVKFSF